MELGELSLLQVLCASLDFLSHRDIESTVTSLYSLQLQARSKVVLVLVELALTWVRLHQTVQTIESFV